MEEPTPLEKFDQAFADHTRGESLRNAHLAGIATGILAALAWGWSTYFTHLIFPILALPLSIAVGVFVKHFGRGSGTLYGVVAGKYAVLGTMLGQISSILFYVASVEKIPILALLIQADYGVVLEEWWGILTIKEAAIYFVSFIAAYRIGLNPMKKDELDFLLEAKGADGNPKYSAGYFRKNQRLGEQAKKKKTGLMDFFK